MTQRRFDAVLLDLFDTIIHFDYRRIPTLGEDGDILKAIQVNAFNAVQPHAPEVEFDRYREAISETMMQVVELQRGNEREILATDRFRWTSERLGIEDESRRQRTAEAGLEAHFGLIAHCVTQPEPYRDFLQSLAQRMPLGLVSNFDHSPTAWTILDKFGIRDLFKSVVISADLGWKKPHPSLFERAVSEIGVEPGRILFVGDTPHADVLGAHRFGMATAWVSGKGAPYKDDLPRPDYTVGTILELAELLGV